jgi:hypothetical protein
MKRGSALLATHFSEAELREIRFRAREAVVQARGMTAEEYEACRQWVLGNAGWRYEMWNRRRYPAPSRWALKFWKAP